LPSNQTLSLETAAKPGPQQDYNENPDSLRSLITVAIWFAMVCGFVEGLLLLVFQRVNWERWGAVAHVSRPILWISPAVDVLLFTALALLLRLLLRFLPHLSPTRIVIFVLAFLTLYDWLTLSERISHRACELLALGVAVAGTRWFDRNRDRALRFSKTSLVWLGAAWLLTFAGIQGAARLGERHALGSLPPAAPGAPNILVIVVDTLRADHLSAYGYARETSPNLDRFASQGVLFENAISAASWTLPSHASLVTGRYPSEHGWQNVHPMPWMGWGHRALNNLPTLGEALESKGYRTAAFSANQTYFTSNVGLGRGFLRFEDYFQSAPAMFLSTLYGREFDRFYLHRTEKSKITRGLRAIGLTNLLDDRKRASEVNREALAWIDKGRGPFFAFLNYIDVHDATALEWPHSPPRWGNADPIDAYDSAIRYVDEQIGEFLHQLDQRGLDKDTLVIITSDHGEGLGEHRMQYHGIGLFREQIHVPLVLRFPGHIPAGVRVRGPRSNAAIAATVMNLGDEAGSKIFPGTSLSSSWNGPNPASQPWPISELQKNGIDDRDGQARQVEPTAIDGDMKSLVTPEWHLIVHQTMGAQIYRWIDDPGELHNRINTPEGQAAAKSLEPELPSASMP
jgi:arylsulfatase A-like enzyme